MIECSSRPLHPLLALVASTMTLAYSIAALAAIVLDNKLMLYIALLGVFASTVALAAIVCTVPGGFTASCLLALIYPLAGLAAYFKARKAGLGSHSLCRSLAILSTFIAVITPLTVYYCLTPRSTPKQ